MIPKISVITPIYKTEQYLDKCLTALVNQTLPDIEFVWIDNGASDECRNIIAKYADKHQHIKVVHLLQNKGYGGAMNAGLEVATGDYIGFVILMIGLTRITLKNYIMPPRRTTPT